MKKFKILLLSITLLVAVFYSCSDNDPAGNTQNTTDSVALRTYLRGVKNTMFNTQGRLMSTNAEDIDPDSALCFTLVYPVTLSYNDGSTVTVNSADGLMNLLMNETSELYLEGIMFPFQIDYMTNMNPVTINNEQEFMDAVVDCGYETGDDVLIGPTCFELVYPFSVINQDNQVIEINDESELMSTITTQTPDEYIVDFVYPLTINYNGENVTVNDIYEFYEYADCMPDACYCPENYDPVCVDTPEGIVGFPNSCFAECAGFTSSDFIDCN